MTEPENNNGIAKGQQRNNNGTTKGQQRNNKGTTKGQQKDNKGITMEQQFTKQLQKYIACTNYFTMRCTCCFSIPVGIR